MFQTDDEIQVKIPGAYVHNRSGRVIEYVTTGRNAGLYKVEIVGMLDHVYLAEGEMRLRAS